MVDRSGRGERRKKRLASWEIGRDREKLGEPWRRLNRECGLER